MFLALILSDVPAIAGRTNIGWVFFGLWLALFAVMLLIKAVNCGVIFTVVNIIVCMGAIFFLCGPALMRKPAGIVRMGLGLRTIPLGTFNIIFTVFLTAGFLIIIVLWRRQKVRNAIAQAAYEEEKAAKAAQNA
jgi:hypothetical protein